MHTVRHWTRHSSPTGKPKASTFTTLSLLTGNGNRTEWSPLPVQWGLICLLWVWSQTDLEDTKSYHQSLIKITILEKKRRAKLWKRKFAVKDWQGRHKLFNVPLKLTTIKMNVIVWSKTTTLKVIGLLNCLVTNFLIKNCPITTWQVNYWKIGLFLN